MPRSDDALLYRYPQIWAGRTHRPKFDRLDSPEQHHEQQPRVRRDGPHLARALPGPPNATLPAARAVAGRIEPAIHSPLRATSSACPNTARPPKSAYGHLDGRRRVQSLERPHGWHTAGRHGRPRFGGAVLSVRNWPEFRVGFRTILLVRRPAHRARSQPANHASEGSRAGTPSAAPACEQIGGP